MRNNSQNQLLSIFQMLMCRNPRFTRLWAYVHSTEDRSDSTQHLPHHSQSDQISGFLLEFQVNEMEVVQISLGLCSISQARASLLSSERNIKGKILIANQKIEQRYWANEEDWFQLEYSLLQLDDSVVFEEIGDVSHESRCCGVSCLSSHSRDQLLSMLLGDKSIPSRCERKIKGYWEICSLFDNMFYKFEVLSKNLWDDLSRESKLKHW